MGFTFLPHHQFPESRLALQCEADKLKAKEARARSVGGSLSKFDPHGPCYGLQVFGAEYLALFGEFFGESSGVRLGR